MKLTEIHEGMVVKNYKELCSLLNERVKTGESKQIQVAKWSKYFIHHKEGNKIVIDKILTEEQEVELVDNRGGNNNKYKEGLMKVIKHMASSDNDRIAIIKKSEAQEVFNFVSTFCQFKSNSTIAKEIGVEEWIINDIMKRNYNSFTSSFESAVKTLKKNGNWLISELIEVSQDEEEYDRKTGEFLGYKTTKTILHTGDKFYEEYTKTILQTEKEVMADWNISKKSDLFRYHRYLNFLEEVCSRVRKKNSMYDGLKSYTQIYYINGADIEEIINYTLTPEELEEILISIREEHYNSAIAQVDKKELKALAIYQKAEEAKRSRINRLEDTVEKRIERKQARDEYNNNFQAQQIIHTDVVPNYKKALGVIVGKGSNKERYEAWEEENKGRIGKRIVKYKG